jgi:hypothetical protein
MVLKVQCRVKGGGHTTSMCHLFRAILSRVSLD